MPFTDEDKKELAKLIAETMTDMREARRLAYLADRPAAEENIETRLFLITVPNKIACPDERGRAILVDVVYARGPVREGGFFGGKVTIVAYGDGKLLPKPMVAHIGSYCQMVEVDEGFLETAQ